MISRLVFVCLLSAQVSLSARSWPRPLFTDSRKQEFGDWERVQEKGPALTYGTRPCGVNLCCLIRSKQCPWNLDYWNLCEGRIHQALATLVVREVQLPPLVLEFLL